MFNIYELSRLRLQRAPIYHVTKRRPQRKMGIFLATVRMRDIAWHGIGQKMHF